MWTGEHCVRRVGSHGRGPGGEWTGPQESGPGVFQEAGTGPKLFAWLELSQGLAL